MLPDNILLLAFNILYFLFLFRIIFKLISGSFSPNSPMFKIGEAIFELTEPILAPVRKIVPPIGGTMDISPLLVLFLIRIIQRMLMGAM
ncbi:YggT family protein [Natranaerobius trueperi]|uniref:YggT family protein n=1 Tax=Natranaerobius trueperi TaxID=759412 RepID=A0A226BVC2_9FIRM|nr:YggT family protein [Natranaerobius trueperi]OWZ82925.1 hypothetical protein CDO51_11335 [Natranaerobius trueperi]